MSLQTLRVLEEFPCKPSRDLSILIDRIAVRIVRRASRHTAPGLCERLEEEWLADLSQRRDRVSRLSFALGCCCAAAMIGHGWPISAPLRSAPTTDPCLRAGAPGGSPRLARASLAAGAAICEVNTTPLIDVMLVLLVTLIVTLPIMTHAVRLNLPQSPPSDPLTRVPAGISRIAAAPVPHRTAPPRLLAARTPYRVRGSRASALSVGRRGRCRGAGEI